MKKVSASFISLLLVIAIVVVVNYLIGGLRFLNERIDLTENRIYTLSEGTKKVLSNLDAQQTIFARLYVSKDHRLLPQAAQNYAKTIEDLLLEMQEHSGQCLRIERIDPRPNSEAEDRAIADAVPGHVANMEGDKAYFGLVIQSLQQKELIDLSDETMLEYQVIRAVAKLSKNKRQVVGVMSAMPMMGVQSNLPPLLMQQPQAPTWLLINQLRMDYEVKEIPTNGTRIEEDVDILLVLHPADLLPTAEYAIDQYLLQGGKVLAMVDPQSLVSERYNTQGQMGRAPVSHVATTSDLPHLFKAWGVDYDKNSVVADMMLRMPMAGGAQPTFLNVGPEFMKRDEMILKGLPRVDVFSTGAFKLTEKTGLKSTVLIESSQNSQLIDALLAERARSEGLKTFSPSNKRHALAVRLEGNFVTAFPDGKPKDKTDLQDLPKLPGAPEQNTETAETSPVNAQEPVVESLKDSQKPGLVYLFADSDFAYEGFFLNSDRSGRLANSNLPLLMNIIEMLAGGSELIDVRSRAVTSRPFSRMEQLRAEVEAEYRPQIAASKQRLNEIVQKIAELGGVKEENGQILLDANQEQRQQWIDEQVAIQREVRELQKAQNRRKERLEMTLTLINLLAVPLVVIAVGIAVGSKRRFSQAVK